MSINITMPALSPTMEEGTLSKWLVKEGDTIASGDVIAEIETDKATMEVEAVDEGTVAKLLVPAGTEGVKVNAVIAVLAEEGEDASSVEVPDAKAAPEPAKEAKKESSEDTKKSEEITAKSDIVMVKSDKVGGSQGKKELATTPLPSANTADGRIKASPLARRIADMKGIDLSAISGTGPRGRIIKRDVENAKPGAAPAAASATAPKPDGLILPQVLDDRIYAPDSYELKPLDGMRKTVARRLTESFMQVPHFPLNVDLNIDRLLASRSAINVAAEKGVKISVNDMLIKAAALALMDEPDCNASFTDKGIAYHKHANVSVAVAVDGGLITPVIFEAEEKGLSEIFQGNEGPGGAGAGPETEAAGIYRRNVLDLEPRHVRHQVVRLDHQSAGRHDPLRRRRRKTRCGQCQGQCRSRDDHERHAYLRPPRDRRRRGRKMAPSLQALRRNT
jgi:pyruvate dehydrogenase E2 component (dihydrolipoamide acetyltransferase)